MSTLRQDFTLDHNVSKTPPGGSFNVSEPPWDEILMRKSNREAVKHKFESWFHYLALGILLPHSVPEFPRVYKTNPSDHLLSTHCVPSAFTHSFFLSQPEKAGGDVVTPIL